MSWRLRDRLHRHEADIVAVAGVARAGIAEADEEQHGVAAVSRRERVATRHDPEARSGG